MKEIWKDIEGYEGRYEVSSSGRVRAVGSGLLVQYTSHDGYRVVWLNNNGPSYPYHVHRLVAKAFCEGYEPGLQVNHIDENKENNRADNLEWVTPSQNMRHNDLQLRSRERATTRHQHDEKRKENGRTLRELRKAAGMTTSDAAEMAGISMSTLERIESGLTSVSFDTLESVANLYGYTLKLTKM